MGYGLQGCKGQVGGRGRGRRSCQRAMWTLGGSWHWSSESQNTTSRSSRHFSWYYREVTVNVSSG